MTFDQKEYFLYRYCENKGSCDDCILKSDRCYAYETDCASYNRWVEESYDILTTAKKEIDKKDILNALNVIKETCKKYALCESCPFYCENSIPDANECCIQNNRPDHWKIVDENNWRAFNG